MTIKSHQETIEFICSQLQDKPDMTKMISEIIVSNQQLRAVKIVYPEITSDPDEFLQAWINKNPETVKKLDKKYQALPKDTSDKSKDDARLLHTGYAVPPSFLKAYYLASLSLF